jgi:hypothetical protein
MILLNLHSLKETFTSFQGSLSSAIVSKLLDSDIYKFQEDLRYILQARKVADYFELKGQLEINFHQVCGRCCDFKPRSLTKSFSIIIKLVSDQAISEDVDFYTVTSEVFNLENFLLEQFVLESNIFWLPQLQNGEVCSLCQRVFKQEDQNFSRPLIDNSLKTQLKTKLKISN